MAKFVYIQWLVNFFESFDQFIFEWDSGNSIKSELKHNIGIELIESCFLDNKIMALGIQVQPKHVEERYGIIAKASDGKILFVCFTIRTGKIRPISGRIASKKEREIYEA